MFTAIFFLNALVVVFAVTIVAMVVGGIYNLFIKPDAPTTGATRRSRNIQH